MADATIRIPADVRDRLAQLAAAEGMSLRAYLVRLADARLTPSERASTAGEALSRWNGYDPGKVDEAALDAELDRRITGDRTL